MDDLTLGEMLTAAHRRQVDYCGPEGMSVSQSSSSVMFDGSGQPNVTFNMISAHSIISEDTRNEYTHDRSGQPDERNSSNAQIRTLLEEQRQTIIAEYREKSQSSRTPSSSRRRRVLTPTRPVMATENWNFVKLVNKVLQKWKNH